MRDTIQIQDLSFTGLHGCYPYERKHGCRFSVDLEVVVDCTAAGQSDQLEDGLDYTKIAAIVLRIGEGPSVNMIEHLATIMCETLLTELQKIEAVKLTLKKHHPPMDGAPSFVAVRLHRERKN